MSNFAAALDRFKKQTLEKVEAVVRESAIEVGDRIVHRTPVKTGRARRNWVATLGAPSNYALNEFDKNGAMTVARIRQVLEAFKLGEVIFIANRVDYALGLEYGRSRQAPNGMVRVTVVEWPDIVAAKARAFGG